MSPPAERRSRGPAFDCSRFIRAGEPRRGSGRSGSLGLVALLATALAGCFGALDLAAPTDESKAHLERSLCRWAPARVLRCAHDALRLSSPRTRG